LRRSFKAGLFASACVLIAACGGTPRLGGASQLRIVHGNELPSPGRIDTLQTAAVYHVGPLDRLVIDVFGIEELSNRDIQVDASGRIAFPMVGAVEAIGKTPGEIESEIAQRLKTAHVRDPHVTVNLKESLSRIVTVEGEVRQPGAYPLAGRATLMGVIAKAQSTTEFSKLAEVVVYRRVEGKRYAALYNLDAIRHGAYEDPEIYSGDLVMVGTDNTRRLFKDVLTAVPALLSPIILLVD
jgi:polysaccharide export outer membrane protein